MDEEIVDFQWFEHVTWDSIKDVRGTTYVQPSRGSSLLYNKLNMPFYEPSFTTTPPLWPQSQLGKRLCSAAGSFWDDLQSMRLRATAHTFWMHDRNSFGLRSGQLWAMARAGCDIAPVQNATRRTDNQQKQSRVRKVATLARTGEKGRALAGGHGRTTSPSHGADCSRDQESLPG